jgi:hypothetical protein
LLPLIQPRCAATCDGLQRFSVIDLA